MPSKPTYDPACEDLARYFLGVDAGAGDVADLAETIQECVEAWMTEETEE